MICLRFALILTPTWHVYNSFLTEDNDELIFFIFLVVFRFNENYLQNILMVKKYTFNIVHYVNIVLILEIEWNQV